MQTQELVGKVAIVTGGAGGIGRASCETLAAEGAQVVVADVDADAGKETADRIGDAAAFKQTDVSDRGQVQAAVDFAVERFGGLDIMFNNAGIGSPLTRFLHDDLEDFSRIMNVNLFGVIAGLEIILHANGHPVKFGSGVAAVENLYTEVAVGHQLVGAN